MSKVNSILSKWKSKSGDEENKQEEPQKKNEPQKKKSAISILNKWRGEEQNDSGQGFVAKENVVKEKPENKKIESVTSEWGFVNFRHHDEYSMRSALNNTKQALPFLKENNVKHFPICNYNELSGWINQYFTCLDNDVIPILGMEATISNYSSKGVNKEVVVSFNSVDVQWEKPITDLTVEEKDEFNLAFNLILYAKDLDGYYNIIKNHNHAQIDGYSEGKTRLDERFLSNHGKGIVAIAPTINGDLVELIVDGKIEEAVKKASLYKKTFDEFYIGIDLIESDFYKDRTDTVIEFAREHDIKLLVQLNSHYIEKEDTELFDILMNIGSKAGKKVDEGIDVVPNMCLRTLDEVRELYKEFYESDVFTEDVFNECVQNVKNLSDSIDTLNLDTTPKLPKFEDAESVLRKKAFEGLNKRLGDKLYDGNGDEYTNRLEYELENVIRAGFADYFLFLEDMVSWCRENDVLVGPGRGSGAGSLVLYCLGITQVDPLKYQLLFERFLDASRLDEIVNSGGQVSGGDYPDVDLDFSDRDAVKAYLVEKYGEKNTCSIGTVGRMKNKSVLIDLARSQDISQDEVYEVTKGDMKDFGDDEEKLSLEQLRELAPSLDAFLNKHPKIEKMFSRMKGTVSFWGKHAGGVLVSDTPLTDELPLRRVDDKIVACWSEGIADRELGRMGFIKMDILGVEQLTQLQATINLVNENLSKMGKDPLVMYDLDLNDRGARDLANKFETVGVFQLDSHLTEMVVKGMGGIKCFEDYSTVSALMRPSALSSKLHDKFGARRNGEEEFEVPDCLKEELGLTYGLTVYQESAYHVAKKMCGFDIVEAYKFMKLLYKGKMTSDKVPEWKEKFMKGAQKKIDSGEVTQKYAEDIFQDLLNFQGYGFCKAHAISYAMFSAWGLFLKKHYFLEYMCCLLNRTPRTKKDNGGNSLLDYRIKYAKRKGVSVIKPCVNKSKAEFHIDGGKIVFGLKGLKGLSSGAYEVVKHQPYKNLTDFCEKVSSSIIHKSRFEALLFAGCFDSFDNDRQNVYNWYHNIWRENRDKKNDEQGMFDFLEDMIEENIKEKEVFFTDDELEKKEIEIVGMKLGDDIVLKYYEQIKKEGVKTIDEMKKSGVKYPTVLCKVQSISDFVTKDKRKFVKINMTDGIEGFTMIMSPDMHSALKNIFTIGNELFLPLTVNVGDKYTSYYYNDREEYKILNRGV